MMDRLFECKMDIVFYAEDIDDAMTKLANHLLQVVEGGDTDIPDLGNIIIKPAQDDKGMAPAMSIAEMVASDDEVLPNG